MATGTVKFFAQTLYDALNRQHDFDSDDIRFVIVTNAVAPAVNTPTPHVGGSGATNFLSTQVAITGTSYTGPTALSNEALVLTATGALFRADPISLAQDPSGFTNGAFVIIFNNTHPSKLAIGYLELSSDGLASLVAGPVSFPWNGANHDIFALAQG